MTFGRLDNDRHDRAIATTQRPTCQSTPTWRYWPSTATFISYNKTALWLHTLENHLGWPTMQKVLATYFERWRFRHPKPDDFFAVVNEVSGQDLTWFFDQAHRSSNTFDYAIQDVRSDQAASGAVSHHRGRAPPWARPTFPVEVVTTFEGGAQATERWNGLDRRVIFQYERAGARHVGGRGPAAGAAAGRQLHQQQPHAGAAPPRPSLKWALSWMVWLQQLMLSYGFFA